MTTQCSGILNPYFEGKCPHLIINSISQHGYTDAYWYSQGKNIKRKFVGWSGNTSLEPEDLLEDILALKSNGSMPYVMLKLKDKNGGIWFEHRNLTVRVKTKYFLH